MIAWDIDRIPPTQKAMGDICIMLTQRPHWYRALLKANQKWLLDIPTAMAFIKFESNFKRDARPPNSSAYGFSQALNGTWDQYVKENSIILSNRKRFSDSVDFIGWYNKRSQNILKLNNTDAYSLYLAYYNGHHSKKYRNFKTAKSVHAFAVRYRKQLKNCY